MRTLPLLLAVAVVGCNKSGQPDHGANPAAGPPVVKVTRPAQKPVKWAIEQPASVQPLEATPIVAKLPGYLKTIAPDVHAIETGVKLPGGQEPVIDIGSVVEPNQLLATLYIPELTAEVAEKAAGVKRAEAEKVQTERERDDADDHIKEANKMDEESTAGI